MLRERVYLLLYYYFNVPMLKKFTDLKKNHQLLFSLIILSGVVCLWRGVWGLLDMYLFPENLSASYAVSVLIGMIIITLTHYTIDKLV